MFDKNNLHHAYVIEGDKSSVLHYVQDFLRTELGVVFENNPDLFIEDYQTLNIEEAREIKEVASRKFFGNKRFFILSFNTMGVQAMNALLKTLEEPTENNHFFLITPNSARLLPTLLSRVVVVKPEISGVEKPSSLFISAHDFIKISKDKRMEEVKKILALLDKEKIDKGEIVDFIKEIALINRSKDVAKMLDYALDPSPSLKMILEFIALSV